MLARMSFSSLNARTLLFARPLFTVIENMELKREKKRRNPGPVGWLGRRLQKKNTALSPSFFSFFFFFYRCKPCSALYTPAETQNDGRVRAIYFRTYGQHMFPLGPVNIRNTKMVRTLLLYLLLKLLTF